MPSKKNRGPINSYRVDSTAIYQYNRAYGKKTNKKSVIFGKSKVEGSNKPHTSAFGNYAMNSGFHVNKSLE